MSDRVLLLEKIAAEQKKQLALVFTFLKDCKSEEESRVVMQMHDDLEQSIKELHERSTTEATDLR